MDDRILQGKDESNKAYRIRLYKNKDAYNLKNAEIGRLCNEAFGVEFDESAHRKKVQSYLEGYNDALEENLINSTDTDNVSNIIKELNDAKIELQKERYKLQSEKIDYNRSLREEARDELITEKIVDAISKIENKTNTIIRSVKNKMNTDYILVLSDCHYGCEFELKGLDGSILNSYSPEIFEKRMNILYNKVIDIVEKENIGKLHIYDCGDDIDGCLRVSQLWKLRYGVVDSTIKYASYISDWLNKLSEYVQIEYQMVIDANHSQLRMLGQPKNTFSNDNMSKVIATFIKERLKYNPNFKFIENETGLIYDNICGFNVIGMHGEMKNLTSQIRNFSSIYNIDINYLFAGHIHHNKSEEVGKYCEIINVGSIIGMDDYALSLNKSSLPCAKMFVFEEGVGKTVEYNIVLE